MASHICAYRAARTLDTTMDRPRPSDCGEGERRYKKLERIVWDAFCTRQEAGLDSEAARLRRAIQGS